MIISGYRRALLQALDFLCLLLALALSGILTLTPDLEIFTDYTGATLFTIFFYMFFFYVLDAYSVGHEDFRETTGRVLVACLLGSFCSAVASYSFDHWRFDRLMLLLQLALSFVLCLGWRFLYHRNAERLTHPLRVLLLGADTDGKVRRLLSEGVPHAKILGYVGERSLAKAAPGPEPWLGPSHEALNVASELGATMIVLLPDAPIDDDIARSLLKAKLNGAMVVDIRSFYEHVARRLPLSQISDEWLLQCDGFSLNTRGSLRRLKRALDVCISLFLLALTSPVMLLAAICVRLGSAGPVIYKQKRVGLHEREFTVYKFRSMSVDAEKNGAVWASAHDSRVTGFGRVMRKLRIDELPQLWNVLRGDMSFIGPRPERMEFVRRLEETIPFYWVRHSVMPGLTGWAQVCYPYGASEDDARIKLEYDLYYIKNTSLLLDLIIIMKTVGVILFPTGAR